MGTSVEPLGYILKRAQALLRHAMDEALIAHGLSMAQYALMSNLDRGASLTNAELARRVFVTPQTTIRIVSDLEHAGLVTRTTDPSNRRRLNTTLTSAGSRRLHIAERTVNKVQERMLEGITEKNVEHLRHLLDRVVANLDPSPAEGSLA